MILIHHIHMFSELTNRVEIQASSEEPVAGELFTLTCTITSDVQSQVTWIGPNGQSVDGELQEEASLMSTVTFSALHTSHSGMYTCVSRIVSLHSRRYTTYSLRVHSKHFQLHVYLIRYLLNIFSSIQFHHQMYL